MRRRSARTTLGPTRPTTTTPTSNQFSIEWEDSLHKPIARAACNKCGFPFAAGRPENKGHATCPTSLTEAVSQVKKKIPYYIAEGPVEGVTSVVVDGSELKEVRESLNRTLRALDKERKKTDVIRDATYSALRDAANGLTLEPVPLPRGLFKETPSEEHANPWIADWQAGKETSTYNIEVMNKRIDVYTEKIMKLTDIQRKDHPVNICDLWALGDLVEGELIFPGQSHLIHDSVYGQMMRVTEIIVKMIRRLLTHFKLLRISWVHGNHGRAGGRLSRDYHPDSNFERIMWSFIMKILADEPRIEWNFPASGVEDNWYVVSNIGGYRTLLIHGDQIDGGVTTENGVRKKVLGWKSGGLGEPFDDVAMGHWHHTKVFSFNDTIVRIAGSPESSNGYTKLALGTLTRPSQFMQFVKPGFGPTAQYTCWL